MRKKKRDKREWKEGRKEQGMEWRDNQLLRIVHDSLKQKGADGHKQDEE